MIDGSWGRASQGGVSAQRAPRYSYAMHQRVLRMYRHVVNAGNGCMRRHGLGGRAYRDGNEPTVRFSDFASAAR